jgi:hypothetical protein
MSNFEAIGGHMYSIEEKGPDGYDSTVICVEIENGHIPFVVSMSRPPTKAELDDLLELVTKVWRP